MAHSSSPQHWQKTLEQIDTLLYEHVLLWRAEDCRDHQNAKQQPRYSALFHRLQQFDDRDVQRLQADDHALLEALQSVFPPAAEIARLIQLPMTPQVAAAEPPTGLSGKKWQQVQAFLNAQAAPGDTVIEWCCGKGLIGEALSISPHFSPSRHIHGLDIDAQLVAAGNQRASASRQPRQLHCCDVLSDASDHWLAQADSVLALHACGGLHQRLLTRSCALGVGHIVLSPCCYHRFIRDYKPLSERLRASPLTLSTADLRLAVRQTATARRGEHEARRQLHRWHLASQQLAARWGVSLARYRSLPHSAAKQGFEAFLTQQLAANQLAARQPNNAERDAALQQASDQQRDQEQRGLAAMLFRRLLEMRCVLDSVVYLEEQSYSVNLKSFCATQLSPRNLIISASR